MACALESRSTQQLAVRGLFLLGSIEPNASLISPGSVSLGQSILFGLQLSEGRTFPFFSPGSVSPGQSVLFGLLLSEGRIFPFFSPGSVSLGQSVLFGLLLSEGKTFPFFYLVLSLMVSCFILDCVFSSYDKIILSMNRNIIKFTCLDFFPLQISLNVNHEKS